MDEQFCVEHWKFGHCYTLIWTAANVGAALRTLARWGHDAELNFSRADAMTTREQILAMTPERITNRVFPQGQK